MSEYRKVNDFAAKDAINAPIVGQEFQDEFDEIQEAVNSKADSLNAVLTGVSTVEFNETNPIDSQIVNVGYVESKVDSLQAQIDSTATLERVYPVGSMYINTATGANPSSLLGFGSWVRYAQGRVLVGLNESDDSFNSLGETGGAKTHTLSINEMPSHNHGATIRGSGGGNDTGPYREDLGACSANNFIGNFSGIGVTTSNNGGNQPHNNLQPYITVYMWTRVA